MSLGLPADPGMIAEALGPDYDVLPPSSEPPFEESPPASPASPAGSASPAGDGLSWMQPPIATVRTILVVTMYDRELLPILATRPSDAVVVLVTPPGADVPPEFGAQARADVIGPASSVANVVALVHAAPSEVPGSPPVTAPWWVGSGQPALPAPGGPGGPGTAVGTAAAGAVGRRPGGAGGSHRRRNGLIAAAAVIAVVLGTGAAVLAAGVGTDSTRQAADRFFAAGEFPGDGTGYGRIPSGGFGEGRGRYGGFPGGGGPQGRPGLAVDQSKLQECLQSKGVTVDGGNAPSRPDLTDPKVREAFRQCIVQLGGGSGLPDGGPGGSGGPDGPGGSGRSGGNAPTGLITR
ncbi:hypothetical protein [Protofrankia symbiont of Coriaria ruscifolia]|uniref:hypothetical protein n=1 Tax=Protofrankia symbiont of Coriaria ruscifolia TaxID=1306542 RepID=UPI0013EF7E09|nr:hypothetical protein [Protofrankia symbiont of Coriaria ruscifolia]